jgi:zinc transport system substrate-binding protein
MKSFSTYLCWCLCLITALFLFNGCGNSSTEISKDKPVISVSVLPQKYFVQRIAGDNVEVHVMIPPGHSPASYSPTPQQMTKLSRSKLYFRIGHIPFETTWMENIASNAKHMKIVDTSAGVQLITTVENSKHEQDYDQKHDKEHAQAHEHGHAEGHEHHHSGIDPHIWLSVAAVKIQAQHILKAIALMDPDNKATYQDNYNTFMDDINRLDREIKELVAGAKTKKFMVFHPAWSYFSRDYGFEQLPIEIEGKTPTPSDLKRIVDIANKENLRVIFVQEQFDTASARAVAEEIGGQVVTMDPLAPDWLDNMKKIAISITRNGEPHSVGKQDGNSN